MAKTGMSFQAVDKVAGSFRVQRNWRLIAGCGLRGARRSNVLGWPAERPPGPPAASHPTALLGHVQAVRVQLGFMQPAMAVYARAPQPKLLSMWSP